MLLTAAAVLACAALGAAITWRVSRHRQKQAEPTPTPAPPIPIDRQPSAAPAFDSSPHVFLFGEPPEKQLLVLEDEEPFRISAVDYLTGSGKVAARQELQLAGRHIELAVEDAFVRAVLRLQHSPWDGSGSIQFRFQAHRGEATKAIVFVLYVVPEITLGHDGRMSECRRLIDYRSTPLPMASNLTQ